MLRDIPVNMGGFKLMVTEEPSQKTRRDTDGREELVTDRDGVAVFTVSLFAKTKGQKGEEIRVTLEADPGDGFADGALVDLINGRVNYYEFTNAQGEKVSGMAFKASGLTPVG